MRYDNFSPGPLRCCPKRFGAQKCRVEPCTAVKDRKFFTWQSGDTIAADAGDSRWRAGPKGSEAWSSKERKNRHDIISKHTIFDESRQVRESFLAQHFMDKRRHSAIPSEDDGFRRRLAVDVGRNRPSDDQKRVHQRYGESNRAFHA